MPLNISCTIDITTCLALRRAVFIEEQKVPEADEIDTKDDDAIHLLATLDEIPVGCARLHAICDIGKIDRVCVLRDHRGKGIGAALINAALKTLLKNQSLTTARLGAQTHAITFYQQLGFTVHGRIYDDAGIPHRDMDYPLHLHRPEPPAEV